MRGLRKLIQIHILIERHPAHMDLQDLDAVIQIRNADLNLPVEPARTAERGIDRIHTVRCRNHNNVPPIFETVHKRQ